MSLERLLQQQPGNQNSSYAQQAARLFHSLSVLDQDQLILVCRKSYSASGVQRANLSPPELTTLQRLSFDQAYESYISGDNAALNDDYIRKLVFDYAMTRVALMGLQTASTNSDVEYWLKALNFSMASVMLNRGVNAYAIKNVLHPYVKNMITSTSDSAILSTSDERHSHIEKKSQEFQTNRTSESLADLINDRIIDETFYRVDSPVSTILCFFLRFCKPTPGEIVDLVHKIKSVLLFRSVICFDELRYNHAVIIALLAENDDFLHTTGLFLSQEYLNTAFNRCNSKIQKYSYHVLQARSLSRIRRLYRVVRFYHGYLRSKTETIYKTMGNRAFTSYSFQALHFLNPFKRNEFQFLNAESMLPVDILAASLVNSAPSWNTDITSKNYSLAVLTLNHAITEELLPKTVAKRLMNRLILYPLKVLRDTKSSEIGLSHEYQIEFVLSTIRLSFVAREVDSNTFDRLRNFLISKYPPNLWFGHTKSHSISRIGLLLAVLNLLACNSKESLKVILLAKKYEDHLNLSIGDVQLHNFWGLLDAPPNLPSFYIRYRLANRATSLRDMRPYLRKDIPLVRHTFEAAYHAEKSKLTDIEAACLFAEIFKYSHWQTTDKVEFLESLKGLLHSRKFKTHLFSSSEAAFLELMDIQIRYLRGQPITIDVPTVISAGGQHALEGLYRGLRIVYPYGDTRQKVKIMISLLKRNW